MRAVALLGVYEVTGHPDVHLVEVSVTSPPGSFDVGAFTQEDSTLPRQSWQVAYNEWYLSADGVPLREFQPPPEIVPHAATRLAFFLHYLDFSRPLLTPFASVELREPKQAPDRLKGIEYEPAD